MESVSATFMGENEPPVLQREAFTLGTHFCDKVCLATFLQPLLFLQNCEQTVIGCEPEAPEAKGPRTNLKVLVQ